MTNRLMIDIETLASSEDALVLSIGAVVFNSDRVVRDFYVNVDPYSQPGGHIEVSNIMWWLQQSDGARQAFFNEDYPSQHPIVALDRLADFYHDNKIAEVWANPPTFDLAVIRNLWKDTTGKYSDMSFIWPWKKEMCFRTAMRVAPNMERLKRDKASHHNALEDARHQAMALISSGTLSVKEE